MTHTGSTLLASLPAFSFGFMLVLCRVGAALMVLPGFGETEIPATVRVGLALGVTILIFPAVQMLMPQAGDAALHDLSLILGELVFGIFLGWLARLMALSLPIAGQLISIMIGLSSVLQPDPELGPQTTGVSRVLALAVPVFCLSSGLYALPLAALAGSYHALPPGRILLAADAASSIAAATEESFSVSIRLAAPIILGSFIWQVLLGMLARLVPSLQVYSLSLPGQLLGGLLLLGALLGPILSLWMDQIGRSFSSLPGL